MSALRQRMTEDMQLRGLSERTQESYIWAVRQLAEYYSKSPDQVSEEALRQYFLYLKNEKRASRSTCTLALCGIKFFYEYTLRRDWPTLSFVRPAREHKLPVVLSQEEVGRILGCLRQPRYRVCLTLIYSCGLRLQEGVQLQVADIDSARMLVRVRQGKGNKDRYVPLPQPTLELLRAYWVTHPSSGVAVSRSWGDDPTGQNGRPQGFSRCAAGERYSEASHGSHPAPFLWAPVRASGQYIVGYDLSPETGLLTLAVQSVKPLWAGQLSGDMSES